MTGEYDPYRTIPVQFIQGGASPRIMPVMVPMPDYSHELTVVTVDKDGNVHIYTEQDKPEPR